MMDESLAGTRNDSGDVSVILPVLREQSRINGLIRNLRNQPGSALCEIIVVDGDPHGGTLAVIDDSDVVQIQSEPGRAIQMNAGANQARGEILLFLHADTLLPQDGLLRIREAIARGFAGGAFVLRFNSPRLLLRLIAAVTSLRARLTRVPFGDQAIFFTAQHFQSLGGYKPLPIMEDVELMQRARKKKLPIALLSQPVTTSARRWETEGVLFCTLRNWTLRLSYLAGVSPKRLSAMYRPHKD